MYESDLFTGALPFIVVMESLDQIYRAHHGWLTGWLRRRLDAPEAEELAHDMFVRLIASGQVDRLREPRAFLTILAQGFLANFWRRKAVENAYLEVLATQPESLSPSSEQHALVLESIFKVDQLLSSISPKAKHAFLLARIDGLTHAQIAVEVGVSERMVRKYLNQAMRILAPEKAAAGVQ